MRTLVLAAGRGTRLRPLTDHVPKALAPVGGRPVVEHLLERLDAHPVVNLHWLGDQVRARLGERAEYSEERELLGTAGALRAAHRLLGGGDVMVLSGDGFHEVDLAALAERHRESGAAATITVKPLADPGACAHVELDARGLVTGFVEKPPQPLGDLASIGLYCFTPAARERVAANGPSDIARDLVPALLAAGLPVAAYETRAAWRDIGTVDQLLRANLELARGRALVLAGSRVDGTIEDAAVVGPGARVGRGARVARALVLPGAEVPAGAVVEDQVFGDPAAVAEAWRRW